MPNVNYIVVDAETGTILRGGSAPERLVCLQANDGEKCIKVDKQADDSCEYYDFKEKKVKEIPGRRAEIEAEKVRRQQAQKTLQANANSAIAELNKIKDGASVDSVDEKLRKLAAFLLQDYNYFKE